MITTFLRLDLYDFSSKSNKIDSVDLESYENVHDLLRGFDINYCELYLVTKIDSLIEPSYVESLVCCFRRIKLKNQKKYQWLTCERNLNPHVESWASKMTKAKYIYMWFDGDVKRHYFSSKLTFNKWLNEFVDEFMKDPLNCNYFYKNLKLKSKKEVKKYFSEPIFLEKVYLDI